jgi:hypothetical protein
LAGKFSSEWSASFTILATRYVKYTPREVMVGDKRRCWLRIALREFVFELVTMGWGQTGLLL